jgi:hypothetical protein
MYCRCRTLLDRYLAEAQLLSQIFKKHPLHWTKLTGESHATTANDYSTRHARLAIFAVRIDHLTPFR